MKKYILLLLLAIPLAADNVKLYLKDGSHHVVREYAAKADRVRYFSVERGEWEEIPLELVDLARTRKESEDRARAVKDEAAAIAAEEKAERELEQEIARVPGEPGVYMVSGKDLVPIPQAETKVATNKRRSILKAVAPIPIVAGKATLEVDGERAHMVAASERPEFYFRLATLERFAMVKATLRKGNRVIENWSIIPVTKEIVNEHQEVPIFKQQVDDGLYKIWPMKPLAPGQYAIIEYSELKGNTMVWDFGYGEPAGPPPAKKETVKVEPGAKKKP